MTYGDFQNILGNVCFWSQMMANAAEQKFHNYDIRKL